MDGQVLLWVLVVALIACCVIPMILAARTRRRRPLGGRGAGAGEGGRP